MRIVFQDDRDALSIATTENGKVYRIVNVPGLWFKACHGLVNLDTGQMFMSGVSNFVVEVPGFFQAEHGTALDAEQERGG